MKKFLIYLFLSSFLFCSEFKKGSIFIRDERNIYIFDRDGNEIGKISASGCMVWHNSIGLIIGRVSNDKVALRIYKTTEKFEDIETEIEAKKVDKLLLKGDDLIILHTDKKNILKVAILSKDLKIKDNFPLTDNSGNPVIVNEKVIIHDAKIFKENLFISGYPYHSGEIGEFDLKINKKIPDELKGLFSEEEIEKEMKKKKSFLIKTFSWIARNNRGIDTYDNENLISVCTSSGQITIFSPETGKSKILNFSVDITGEKWGFHGISVLNDEILVSNIHPKVKKIYLIDKKTGEVKKIFKEGISAIEIEVMSEK